MKIKKSQQENSLFPMENLECKNHDTAFEIGSGQ